VGIAIPVTVGFHSDSYEGSPFVDQNGASSNWRAGFYTSSPPLLTPTYTLISHDPGWL